MRFLLPLITACSTLAPLSIAGDFQKITEQRVTAAYVDARAAIEAQLGAQFDEALSLRFATSKEIGRRIAEENLPIVRMRQPDEEKAKLEAATLGEAAGAMMYAKYSWNSREFMVAIKTWESSAKRIDAPELTTDEALRAVMVHELVHAWDDHVYDLTAFLERADSIDAASAMSAIIEGHAQHATRRVCKERGWSAGFDAMTVAIGAIPEASKADGEALMMLLRAQSIQMEFMYHDGERFVAALEKAGGADVVARAFREPPRDGETILRPEWFLDPKSRPATLFDPEPALDVFVARFPSDIWSEQRQTVPSNQLAGAFAFLPKEETEPIVASIRGARVSSCYPTANPAEKIVVLAVLEFGTDAEARAFVEATARLSKLKDERMKTGVVRITSSTTSTIEADNAFGYVQTKSMVNGTFAFELASIDVARGKLVIETIFSGEPIETEEHVKLVVGLFDSVKKRELK